MEQKPVEPVTWVAQGTLYRLRPSAKGRPPVLYATGPSGYARFAYTALTDSDVASWAELTPNERTQRAAQLLPP
jgi:hypothetical protein